MTLMDVLCALLVIDITVQLTAFSISYARGDEEKKKRIKRHFGAYLCVSAVWSIPLIWFMLQLALGNHVASWVRDSILTVGIAARIAALRYGLRHKGDSH